MMVQHDDGLPPTFIFFSGSLVVAVVYNRISLLQFPVDDSFVKRLPCPG